MTDTGLLYNAGWFRLGVRNGIRRFWPTRFEEEPLELAQRVLEKPVLVDDTLWLDESEYRMVADFPQGFFLDRVACIGDDTVIAGLWILR